MSVSLASAVALSVEVAGTSAVLGLAPAVLVGHWLARTAHPAKPLVTALVLVPLVLPPVVTGLLLLDLLGKSGPIGAVLDPIGIHVTFTWLGAVIAAIVVGFPLYTLSIRQAFEAIDPRYAEVAATLGDPPGRAFIRIGLPLAMPGIAAGAVLAFGRALGEFGATVVLAGNFEGRTRTVALAVYTLLDAPGDSPLLPRLIAASLALAVVVLAIYEALMRWHRRRLEGGEG